MQYNLCEETNLSKVVKRLTKQWNVRVFGQTRSESPDFALFRNGEIVAWAEIKIHEKYKHERSTVSVSSSIMEKGLYYSLSGTFPFLLVVQWKGGEIEYLELTELDAIPGARPNKDPVN